ncbi:MAG: hypothetical protein ACFUZC_18680 [Chthoniobacteraceae bacterium]
MCPSPNTTSKLSSREQAERGVALIMVLSTVVLVTILLVAFSSIMNSDRSASVAYSQSVRAEQTASGCLQLIVGDLQREMGKDAAPDTGGGSYPKKPVYTNITGSNVGPQVTATAAAIPTLVKTSGPSPSFTGSLVSGTYLLSTSVSATAASRNGRTVDLPRWNYANFGAYASTDSVPHWVLLTREGPSDGAGLTFGATAASVNNAAVSNSNYVVARFAYAIYDEGGLLDITSAGHPAGMTADDIQKFKGTLAGADLTKLNIDVQKLIQWRNAATGVNNTSFTTYATDFFAKNGYRRVAPGDTNFLSRQDLIRAAETGGAGLSSGTSILPNLTTFTRERNAPSWRPQNPAGVTLTNNFDYSANALTVSSTNVFIPLVRHAKAGSVKAYKIDGVTSADYPVEAGDPLVYRRFPLDRLNWIGTSGPQNGATADAIQTHFGLVWDGTAGWNYCGPSGSTLQASIETLNQVASEATLREPNFFELLQAGILCGSLGAEMQTSYGGAVSGIPYYTTHQTYKPFHLFRIGASIISQYESSSCPIVINYSPASGAIWQACGIENLPYLSMMTMLAGQSSASNLGCYWTVALWNPHQSPASVTRPNVQLHVEGSLAMQSMYGRNTMPKVNVYGKTVLGGTTYYLDATTALSQNSGFGVNGFTDPHVLTKDDLSPAPSAGTTSGSTWATLDNIYSNNSAKYAGYRVPDFIVDPTDMPETVTTATTDNWNPLITYFNNDTAAPFNAWLEFQNPAGKWVPYNYVAGINDDALWFTKTRLLYTEALNVRTYSTSSSGTTFYPVALKKLDDTTDNNYCTKYCLEANDPRSLRFNWALTQTQMAADWSAVLNSSLWSETNQSGYVTYGRKQSQDMAAYWLSKTQYFAALCRNNTAPRGDASLPTQTAYVDPDGVQRIGDSGRFTDLPSTANNWAGVPFALSTTRVADRPVILNRPFYSVADLGYVNRDYPWRTLDFFTANSADSGLLDLFTVSQSDENILGGRIQLNSKNRPAMQAVLASTIADVIAPTALSSPDQIASQLLVISGTGPLVGRDEIVTKFIANIPDADFGNGDERNVKTRREGVARALADVAQTRTWNLMIDLVVQTGRYPTSAKTLDQFMVEGERRYWLHVAIDRITGEVVDQHLEPVNR